MFSQYTKIIYLNVIIIFGLGLVGCIDTKQKQAELQSLIISEVNMKEVKSDTLLYYHIENGSLGQNDIQETCTIKSTGDYVYYEDSTDAISTEPVRETAKGKISSEDLAQIKKLIPLVIASEITREPYEEPLIGEGVEFLVSQNPITGIHYFLTGSIEKLADFSTEGDNFNELRDLYESYCKI